MTNDRAQGVLEALDALEAAGYRMGDAWERAHELAQSKEGEPLYDRLHALCHRIEGDLSNARYWYGRAGVSPASGDFAEEARSIRADAAGQS